MIFFNFDLSDFDTLQIGFHANLQINACDADRRNSSLQDVDNNPNFPMVLISEQQESSRFQSSLYGLSANFLDQKQIITCLKCMCRHLILF